MPIRHLLVLLTLATLAHAQNLLTNPSFEKNEDGRIAGWTWADRQAKATCTIDDSVTRSGDASVRLENPTGRKPHVYGTLTQTVRVQPNKRYTLSCYVKAGEGGMAWIGGGSKWEHRFAFPKHTDGWQRVVGTFDTSGDEAQFTVRILVESKTPGIWIDDVMLEKGGVPTDFRYEPPLRPGEARLELSPFDPGENLAPNPSFEEVHGNRPKDWMWDQRNTDAQMIIENEDPHSGSVCLKFTNGTPFGAHVYGWFGMIGGVKVVPNTSYTLTAFVKSGAQSPGAWIGGGQGWKVRRPIPATNGQWERISRTFTTGEDETVFTLMLVTEKPTDGFWLDDLSLREGIRPLPIALDGVGKKDYVDLYPVAPLEVLYKGRPIQTRWAPQRWPADSWAFCGNEFAAEGIVTVTDPGEPSELTVALKSDSGATLAENHAKLSAGPHAAFVNFRADVAKWVGKQLSTSVRVSRGNQLLAEYTGTLNLVNPERVRMQLPPLEDLKKQLTENVTKLEKQGLGAASRVTLTVLENFIPWVKADIDSEQVDRAWDTVHVLSDMATREVARTNAILAGNATDSPVPRYVTGDLDISHAQTIGAYRLPDGSTGRGPVFFTGYGHFSQVRRDVEKFPGYGCNFFQIEFGPRSVLPNETGYSDGAINDFLAVCDRAAKANVAVNLLLSPHYFPAWAMEKWPYLADCHGGFFKYCVHDSNARAVIEKSLRYVIPKIKDHPAIHSLCLSNEPICVDLQKCRVTAKTWPAWLQKKHGTIETLNQRWQTDYANFAAIPIPAPEIEATPMCLDFIRFNQETFAEFHGWMADIIHEMAPDMPVHAKIMMGAHFRNTLHGYWSVSPELFARVSQYNGNDAYNMYSQSGTLWSNGWRHQQAGYDFQRSMADMPVFNSENHIIVDRDHNVIPPEHLYSELWQNAIHGQSSTTYWVWERTNDHASGATGSILHRPDCVEAVGRCNLDLNRLANEVAAIQNLDPVIVLLWSQSSMVLGTDHAHALGTVYEAANFLGVPLGFATERKLAEFGETGKAPRPLATAKVIILPNVTHLSDAARKGLLALGDNGVRIVVYGNAPVKNDWNTPRDFPDMEALPAADESVDLHATIRERVQAWQLPNTVQLLDSGGKPVFGVESRTAIYDGAYVTSICNHLREPRDVTLSLPSVNHVTDLISGKTLPRTFIAQPMTPLLLRFEQ